MSAALEPNGTIWSRLAVLYQSEGRLMEEIDAWERASQLLPYPAAELLALGYAEIAARRPQHAFLAFDRAVSDVPRRSGTGGNKAFFANVAHGRAMAGTLWETCDAQFRLQKRR